MTITPEFSNFAEDILQWIENYTIDRKKPFYGYKFPNNSKAAAARRDLLTALQDKIDPRDIMFGATGKELLIHTDRATEPLIIDVVGRPPEHRARLNRKKVVPLES